MLSLFVGLMALELGWLLLLVLLLLLLLLQLLLVLKFGVELQLLLQLLSLLGIFLPLRPPQGRLFVQNVQLTFQTKREKEN